MKYTINNNTIQFEQGNNQISVSIEIPEDVEAEEIERYLSDKTGFLHKNFKIRAY